MNSTISIKSLPAALTALLAGALVVAGCSSAGTGTSVTTTGAETGSSFVVGTDAPMKSVVSFSVQLQSVTASDNNGNSVSLISGTPTVDFARFNGLQTLLDMNDVNAGSYNNISITLGAATIGYLQTQAGSAPSIQTMPAMYPNGASTYTFTATLNNPIVVAQNGAPAGLHLDFDLHKSIAVDSNGNVNGDVTPAFNVNGVDNSDPRAYIDCFDPRWSASVRAISPLLCRGRTDVNSR